MTQQISLHTRNANTFQNVTSNSAGQAQGQEAGASGDLFAQFSMILDKIALQLSHNEGIFNISSELRPAVLAPREEQPAPEVEQAPEAEQTLPLAVEEEVIEEEVAEEVEENSEQESGEEQVLVSDDLVQTTQEGEVTGEGAPVEVKVASEPVVKVEVAQLPIGEQAAAEQDGSDIVTRLLREQLTKQQQAAPLEQHAGQEQQELPQQQQVGEDLALKNFLVKNGLIAKDSGSEETKALETALRALFEQSESAQSTLPQEGVQQSIVVSPLLLQRALEMSSFGKSNEAVAQGVTATTPKANTGNGAGHDVSLGQSARRSETAESAETPLSQRATLRTLEKVEQALKEIAKSKDGKTISLRLDPPELGSLKIDVTMRDGLLHARIAADNTQVSQMLREKAHEIQRNLRELGLNVDQVSVSVRDESGQFSQFFSNTGSGTGSENRGQSDVNQQSVADADAQTGTNTNKIVVEDHWVA